MRSFLLPVVTLAAIGFASASMAGTTSSVSGTIKSIDAKAHSVTLADGHVYALPSSVKMQALKVGEKLKLSLSQNGKSEAVTQVKAVRG